MKKNTEYGRRFVSLRYGMRIILSSAFFTLTVGLASVVSAAPQPPAQMRALGTAIAGAANVGSGPTLNAQPIARVVGQVDNSKRSVIPGQTLPTLRNASDLGRVASGSAMNHMFMVLQASPAQDYALKSLIDQQLDRNHPNFHKWLTPDQFGAQLGVADSDIAQVTDWLESQGLVVDEVERGKRFIQFSGSVAQVEAAFDTEMHTYRVGSNTHIANSRDISVPTALRSVITGVPSLNDFFKTSQMRDARKVSVPADRLTGTNGQFAPSTITFSPPDYTNGTTHFVGAGDFATIYNTTPLINAGFDGTGVSIGVIGRTEIDLADVQIYRYMFGLKANDPTVVVAGEDPGVVGGDDGESYLDVEVSGGAAPGASVKFVIARATLTVDGVDLAAMYAVQNNLTDIISESYGQCEANFSAAGAAFYYNLWGQAAAQGQSVFVSSGDNGPAACENSNNTFETTGYAVSMLASSPFNVAVGGTIFAEGTGVGTFWSTPATVAPPFSSALGYIPETPWNESRASGATGAAGLWSGSGGISAYFQTPSWQRGFGVPASDPGYPNFSLTSPASPFVSGPHRYLPDVSLAAAADHDGTLYCAEGICQLSATGSLINAGIVGGTSVAAPSMAGVQALINSKNGGRQGQPGYVYYALADAQHTAGLNCASNAGSGIDPNCAFHDITTGNTLICETSACSTSTTPPSKIGWTATPGYDFATGLGSPNVTNLANLWSTVTFNSSTTSLALSKTSGINHGDSVTLSGTVAAGSGSGTTPTGTVAFFTGDGGLTNPIDADGSLPISVATLDASGNYSIAVTDLPAGTYAVTAHYSGDGVFASSTSAPVFVSASPEGSTMTIQTNALNQTACTETQQTTFTYGSYVWTDLTVAGVSGSGVPTGTVSVTDNGASYVSTTLDPTGVGHFLSGAVPTTSCIFGYTFQDAAPLTGGTHTLGATYLGDSNFGPLTATPITVTITPATVTGALRSSVTNISAGGDPVHLTLTLAALSGAGSGTLPPTGAVTFTDTTTAAVLGNGTLSANGFGAIATFDTNAITAAGAHALTASWAGDANYAAGTTAAVTVTVQAATSTSVVVTSNVNPAIIGGRPTLTATMTPTTVTSGTVNFYDGITFLGTGTVGAAHTATFRPAATVNLPAGIHTITAYYAGNATFNASVSPSFSQTFNPASTTVTVTAQASGTYGTNNNTYYLAATLGTLIAATPPTGTVQFFDGATPLGIAPLTTVSTTLGGFGLFTGSITATLGAGSHSITAVLTDPNYTAPTSTAYPINIGKGTAVITFAPLGDKVFGAAPFTVSAAGTASTPVTFSSNTPTVCTASGSTVTLIAAGTCTIEADEAGDTNFNAAAPVTQSFTVAKASQTITFPPIASFTWLGGSATVSASASSGLPVMYSVISGPCSISGTTVTATAAGSCVIAADQAGDANFNAALEVTQSVTVNKADQTITFAPLAGEALNSAPFTVSATGGGSTNPVTFSSTTTAVCTVSGSTVTLIAAGICTVAANQAGDDNYNAAAEVDQSFTVSSAPVIAMAFQPAAILPNSSTSLVFTLTNPSGNVVPQTGVAFSDTLPAGISVADATTTVCGGTLTTSAATGVIALSGARIEVNSQCQFSVSVTATSGSFVNTSGPVSSSNGGTGNSATATLNAGTASLAVTVTDNSDYARYGQTRNYLLTITNNGSTNATDIGVMQTVSDDFDASGITWTCINGGGTSCTASGTGPLTDSNIVIPPTRSLSWLITASVLFDAPDDSAQTTFTVTSAQDPNAPYVATDSDTLVVFRDGFEVANGDGTGALVQTAETPSSSVLAIPLTIGQSVMLTMPAVAGSSLVDTLMRARAVDGSGFRVERLNFGAPRVRLVSIDSIGVEHAGVWITAAANENVGVGLTDSQGTTAVMETNGGEETLHLSTATQPTYGVAISVDSSVTQ